MTLALNIALTKGSTYLHAVQWMQEDFSYLPIEGITKAAPVKIKATGHKLPDHWPVAIQSVEGMRELNAANDPPKGKDFKRVRVVDADYIELRNVNALNFKPYTRGGVLVFHAPEDLTGCTARMTVRDKVGGTELFSLTTANNRLSVNVTGGYIGIVLTAEDTAAMAWKKGVYDLELIGADGKVTKVAAGEITVGDEITS